MSIFKLPDLGEGLPDAEIVKWLVKPGEEVKLGQPLAEMETAKAVVEIPSPQKGRIQHLHGQTGDVIKTGEALVTFADNHNQAKHDVPTTPVKTTEVLDTSRRVQIFKLPDLGEGLQDAEIVEWKIQTGDTIERDQIIASLETAKAVVDIPAPFSGTVVKLHGQAGDIVKTGTPLLEISSSDSPASHNTKPNESSTGAVVGDLQSTGGIVSEARTFNDGINATPAVRALARKLGIDLNKLNAAKTGGTISLADVKAFNTSSPKIGPAARNLAAKLGIDLKLINASGPKGFITTSDVEQAAKQTRRAATTISNAFKSQSLGKTHSQIKAAPKVRAIAKQLNINLQQVPATGHAGNITLQDLQAYQSGQINSKLAQTQIPALKLQDLDVSVQAIRGSRRTMFSAMSQASDRVMNTTIFDDVDISLWQKEQDITLRFVRAIIRASQTEPKLNAWLDEAEQSLVLHNDVNLGIAVDSENGLYVPVIKAANKKDSPTIREELNAYRQSIKDRTIKPDHLQNCTITLSNFGMIAGKYATPVVSPPQVAILGTGGIYQTLAFDENDRIIKQRLIPLSLSFDHRAVTGGEAARFLKALIIDLSAKI